VILRLVVEIAKGSPGQENGLGIGGLLSNYI